MDDIDYDIEDLSKEQAILTLQLLRKAGAINDSIVTNAIAIAEHSKPKTK